MAQENPSSRKPRTHTSNYSSDVSEYVSASNQANAQVENVALPLQMDDSSDVATQQTPASQGATGERFVRAARPRKTQPPVNAMELDESEPIYEYSSSYSSEKGPQLLSGRGYRRSRAEIDTLKKDLQYGQYLSVPKGHRSIFASRERSRRIRSTVTLLIVVAVLVIAVLVAWMFLSKAMP